MALQNSFTSLFPFGIQHPYPISIFQSLSNAHQSSLDHFFIMSHLKECLLIYPNHIEYYSMQICKYLRTNLQKSIRIIQTVDCLPFIHHYASSLAKREITSLLRDKYPSKVCFYQQIETLTEINLSLVGHFVKLMRGLSRWFRKDIQERDYNNIEIYQFQYILNAFYAEERYKFENCIQLQNEDGAQTVLSLYRITQIIHQHLNQDIWQNLMEGIFYFLCNKGININETSKYVSYSLGEMMTFRCSLMQTQVSMADFIMKKVHTVTQRGKKQEMEAILEVFRDLVVNLLLSGWTVELQSYWLWRFKLACDLMSIEEREQLQRVREIRGIYREISKHRFN